MFCMLASSQCLYSLCKVWPFGKQNAVSFFFFFEGGGQGGVGDSNKFSEIVSLKGDKILWCLLEVSS